MIVIIVSSEICDFLLQFLHLGTDFCTYGAKYVFLVLNFENLKIAQIFARKSAKNRYCEKLLFLGKFAQKVRLLLQFSHLGTGFCTYSAKYVFLVLNFGILKFAQIFARKSAENRFF